ncbi:hypothetical protein ACFPVT_07455 [Corynebacterium choanae]|uniref:Uncharacterized protein n=1 Tax=Corynebacterium choanae TaxID=1862358 RepID=A0A3G6J7S5_9CORY|nr:hypothetical protein [Corynebacterium choanae]AZA13939.1 hypothetical protein CCHOA_07735 [Corynebacterium choanae]
MLLGAIVCALLGFALLVVSLTQPSDLYTWLMLLVVSIGIVLFIADLIVKRKSGAEATTTVIDVDAATSEHSDAAQQTGKPAGSQTSDEEDPYLHW